MLGSAPHGWFYMRGCFIIATVICVDPRPSQALFLWTVQLINTSLGKGEESLPFVGVLDIFGELKYHVVCTRLPPSCMSRSAYSHTLKERPRAQMLVGTAGSVFSDRRCFNLIPPPHKARVIRAEKRDAETCTAARC